MPCLVKTASHNLVVVFVSLRVLLPICPPMPYPDSWPGECTRFLVSWGVGNLATYIVASTMKRPITAFTSSMSVLAACKVCCCLDATATYSYARV